MMLRLSSFRTLPYGYASFPPAAYDAEAKFLPHAPLWLRILPQNKSHKYPTRHLMHFVPDFSATYFQSIYFCTMFVMMVL